MKIQLLTDIPVSDKNLVAGLVLDTIPCPEEHIHLKESDGVWIKGEVEPVRILSREFIVIEKDKPSVAKNMVSNIRKMAIDDFSALEDLFADEILPFSLVIDISCGRSTLIDDPNNEGSFLVIDELDKSHSLYLSKTFSNLFIFEDSVYTVDSMVLDYGVKDLNAKIDFSIDNNALGLRASFYVEDRTSIISLCKYEGHDFNFIFKKVSFNKIFYPFIENNTPQSLVDFGTSNSKFIPTNGFSEHYARSYEKESDYLDDLDIPSPLFDPYFDLKERIIESNENVLGFLPLEYDSKTYMIPIAPFILWFGPAYSSMHDFTRMLSHTYHSISPRGLKMYNDSTMHNDWIIGSGLDIDSYYHLYNNNIKGFADVIGDLKEELILRYGEDEFSSKEQILRTNINILNKRTNEDNIIFVMPKFKNIVENDCVIINKGNAKDIDNILTATNAGRGIILTNSSTEVAHITSNSVELDFTFINVENIDLSEIPVGTMFMINLSLNTIEEIGYGGRTLSLLSDGEDKASMLASLKRNGFNVLDGVFYNEKPEINIPLETELIIRSSGSNEGSSVKASGIFNSIKATEDNNAVDIVWESFTSEVATNYLSRIGASVSPGILIQPYIEADYSYVLKLKEGTVYVSSFNGPCSNIVDGNEGVTSSKYNLENLDPTNKIFKTFLDILEFVESDLECELLLKDDTIYVLQVMKL